MFQELYQIYSEISRWFIPTTPVPSAPPVPMESAREPPPLDIQLLEYHVAQMKYSSN